MNQNKQQNLQKQLKQQYNHQFHFQYNKSKEQKLTLLFSFKKIQLQLYRSFNTAHSSTTTRNNFFVKVQLNHIKSKQQQKNCQIYFGAGQAGLPPKKEKCYLADINDCFQYAKIYQKTIEIQSKNTIQEQYMIKCKQQFISKFVLNGQYFKKLLNIQNSQFFCFLINKLHQQKNPIFRAARSAVQFAIFDLWSNKAKISLYQGIFNKSLQSLQKSHKYYSFYTVSYQQHDKMLQNAKFGLKYTSFIKIKYNHNPKRLIQLLNLFYQLKIGQKWIIDLNSSWSPQQWDQFYSVILLQQKNINQSLLIQPQISKQQSLIDKILYIQQPFKIDIDQDQFQKWEAIKKLSKIKVIADESFSTWNDLNQVKSICHGINIKNQKTGGLLNSLKAAIYAKQNQFEIMFGSMVSSQLGCSQCFQLRDFTSYFDIDGSLLTKWPNFNGGFIWKQKGQIQIQNQEIKGLGFQDQFYLHFLKSI